MLTDVESTSDGSFQPRGFCFVVFSDKQSAAKAVENGCGVLIDGRECSIDLAVTKEVFEKSKSVICLPSDAIVAKTSESKSLNNLRKKEEESDDVEMEVAKDEENESKNESESGEGIEIEMVAKTKTTPAPNKRIIDATTQKMEEDEGRTIFIRNLSFDSDEKCVRDKFVFWLFLDSHAFSFQSFGAIKWVKITRDAQTKMSRGSAFVNFELQDSAQRALTATNSLLSFLPLTMGPGKGKINSSPNNAMPHLLPETSSGIWIRGRQIFATLAVSKETLKLQISGDTPTTKASPQNSHLLHEGLVLASSPFSSNFTPAQLKIRQDSFDNRKRQLRANLTRFYLSKTRLSIRHMGKGVNEVELKKICLDAVSNYHERNPKFAGNQTKVHLHQYKIIRDKINSAQSLGFGFVEFRETEHALACCRYLTEFGVCVDGKSVDRKVVVEFALEDRVKVMLHQKRTLSGKTPPPSTTSKRKTPPSDSVSSTTHHKKSKSSTPPPATSAQSHPSKLGKNRKIRKSPVAATQ